MNESCPWGKTHSAVSNAPGERLIRRIGCRPAAGAREGTRRLGFALLRSAAESPAARPPGARSAYEFFPEAKLIRQ